MYGTLPRELSLLTELKRFMAPKNEIKGNLDDPFHGLSLLDTIVITENKLIGTIPVAVLERNSNLGTPRSHGRRDPAEKTSRLLSFLFAQLCCSSVGVFNVGYNAMTGPLPDILVAGKLSHLQLHDNQFSGTIPEDIGNATRLRKSFEHGPIVPSSAKNQPPLKLTSCFLVAQKSWICRPTI